MSVLLPRIHQAGLLLLLLLSLAPVALARKQVAYIHGDVSSDGRIPSGGSPFHQMLLSDTGNLGCSQFKAMIEGEGYEIASHYDRRTTLNTAFLDRFDVIVFGLHQKIWSSSERTALDRWLNAGGGMLVYSDSAAGGHHGTVGIANPVGQRAVNNLISRYGMEVTVDQGLGTRSYTSERGESHPIVSDRPVFEGEGVSPVAVDESSGARALIPFEESFKVSGGTTRVNRWEGITIRNPRWAALAHQTVGTGNVIAVFDRQPFWNNGPGSDINDRDNREVLRRVVRFLANDYRYPSHWLDLKFGAERDPDEFPTHWAWNADADRDGLVNLAELASNSDPLVSDGSRGQPVVKWNTQGEEQILEVSYRRWTGGDGETAVNYSARGVRYRLEFSPNLRPGSWISGAELVEELGAPIVQEDGTEIVRVRLRLPGESAPEGFVRLSLVLERLGGAPTVEAGDDRYTGIAGAAYLAGEVTGELVHAPSWSKVSGPGEVSFGTARSAETTATFSQPGRYELALTANDGIGEVADSLLVEVFATDQVVKAINCGRSSGHSGRNGFVYVADVHYTGGHTDQFPGNAVANTEDDLLYNYARSAHSSYRIPVSNGDYLVLLQFAETFFTSANKRVFDGSIEGRKVIDDLDLFATAPGKWMAYDRAFETTVRDGQLTLEFSASKNNPLLNGIVILRR